MVCYMVFLIGGENGVKLMDIKGVFNHCRDFFLVLQTEINNRIINKINK